MSADGKPTLFRPGVGSRGMTALHYAAYCGDLNELSSALAGGADPNERDNYRGYAAVHWLADMAAAGGPRVQMLRALIAAGANLNQRADNGATPLQLAKDAGSAAGEQLAEELEKLGANQ
jgi:ankyrin repeat protein